MEAELKGNSELTKVKKESRISRRNFLKLAGGAAVGVLTAKGLEFQTLSAKASAENQEGYPYPPSEILYFNPNKNSGWLYAAKTIPDENGIAFWVAGIRSYSAEPVDTSGQLIYGITDLKNQTYYPGFLQGGAFSEDQSSVNVRYVQNNQEVLKFKQTGTGLNDFQLAVNLPYGEGKMYQAIQNVPFNRPIIYESGDGVVPMGGGITSLYASLALEQGVWVDFQKFNLPNSSLSVGAKPALQTPRGFLNTEVAKLSAEVGAQAQANHRWGCFMLKEAVGKLPGGTVGVYWEIFDKNNKRQPDPPDFTVIDVLLPGQTQKTATGTDAFQIEEQEHWSSGKKSYLKKWRVTQPELGVDLLFTTAIPNQENPLLGNYFYEGIARVYDPNNPQREVGTGMLEQTHNEMERRLNLPFIIQK